MKRIVMILAVTVFAALVNIGCDADLEFNGDEVNNIYSVDNIPVDIDEWKYVWFTDAYGNRKIEYWYADKEIRELTPNIIENAAFATYFKYISDDGVPVHNPLPFTQYFEENDGYKWEYTLEAEYSERNLRIRLRTSDFGHFNPEDTFYFRMVIMR